MKQRTLDEILFDYYHDNVARGNTIKDIKTWAIGRLAEKYKPMSQDKMEKVKWYHNGYNSAIDESRERIEKGD